MGKARAFTSPFAKIFDAISPTKSVAPASVAPTAEAPATTTTASAPSGMQTVVGGDALAVGENTSASGSIYSRSIDQGPVAISFGFADFSASSQTTNGDAPYAGATSYAGATGADVAVSGTQTTSGSGESGGTSYATETSKTFFFALDIKGFDLPGGPITVDQTVAVTDVPATPPPSGNVATFDADAKAEGDGTLVDVQYDAMAVGDRASSVGGIVVTEIA